MPADSRTCAALLRRAGTLRRQVRPRDHRTGFTTERKIGSSDYIALGLRNVIEAGIVEGPRMLIANNAIGGTGGHADEAPLPPDTGEARGPERGDLCGPFVGTPIASWLAACASMSSCVMLDQACDLFSDC